MYTHLMFFATKLSHCYTDCAFCLKTWCLKILNMQKSRHESFNIFPSVPCVARGTWCWAAPLSTGFTFLAPAYLLWLTLGDGPGRRSLCSHQPRISSRLKMYVIIVLWVGIKFSVAFWSQEWWNVQMCTGLQLMAAAMWNSRLSPNVTTCFHDL